MYEQYKKNAEYDIDGLVVSDMLKHKESSGDNPKYTIAFKCNTEFARATVELVEWNISKNGIIKPRVKIQPIQLNGVTITFATGFNAKFIKENNFTNIDLVKINIEGAEYPLLLDLINNDMIKVFDNLQIQFHMIENYEPVYNEIVNGLSKTHSITWRYPFIWENWKRNVND